MLGIEASACIQSVNIDITGYLPEENWFHLGPNYKKQIALYPLTGTDLERPPPGEIHLATSRHELRTISLPSAQRSEIQRHTSK